MAPQRNIAKKTHLGDGPIVLQGHIHNLQETESRLE